jgi:glutamate dehydrogenase/leucine dehydrogenase
MNDASGSCESIFPLENPEVGLQGFLVIHSTICGRACGGIRMGGGVSPDEVRSLARAMTLKYGFLSAIPLGGAKVAVEDPGLEGPDDRARFFDALGRALARFVGTGRYMPATDMMTTIDDLNIVRQAAGLRGARPADSADYTALTVHAAVDAVFEHRGWTRKGATVAIEGFGKVGSQLALRLAREGLRVTAVSTLAGALIDPMGLEVPTLESLRREHGDACVNHYPSGARSELSAVLSADVDVLVPCARVDSINASLAHDVRARAVVPGANCPFGDEVESILIDRGLVVVPDFVSNIGGTYGLFLDRQLPRDKIERLLHDDYRPVVTRLLEVAERNRQSPGQVARSFATHRHAAMKRTLERPLVRRWIDRAFRRDERRRKRRRWTSWWAVHRERFRLRSTARALARRLG